MNVENDVLKDFYLLSDYLKNEGKIVDTNKYKNDFSAFLLHASHIKTYDFIAPFCKNKKILDIGCFLGYGENRIYLEASEIIAIDSDINALKFARKNRNFQNIKFQKLDAKKLPYTNNTFDIVIASQLIEHICHKDINVFLSEVKRVLMKGGLFFVITPNRKFRLLPFQRPFNPEHYQEFTAKTALKTLKITFNDVQIEGFRAKEWIEEIERKRIRKSPFRVYIHDPLYGFLNMILPVRIKGLIKKIKSKMIKSYQSEEGETLDSNDRFNNLFQKFSMDDFYIETKNINKSIDLIAICKK